LLSAPTFYTLAFSVAPAKAFTPLIDSLDDNSPLHCRPCFHQSKARKQIRNQLKLAATNAIRNCLCRVFRFFINSLQKHATYCSIIPVNLCLPIHYFVIRLQAVLCKYYGVLIYRMKVAFV